MGAAANLEHTKCAKWGGIPDDNFLQGKGRYYHPEESQSGEIKTSESFVIQVTHRIWCRWLVAMTT